MMSSSSSKRPSVSTAETKPKTKKSRPKPPRNQSGHSKPPERSSSPLRITASCAPSRLRSTKRTGKRLVGGPRLRNGFLPREFPRPRDTAFAQVLSQILIVRQRHQRASQGTGVVGIDEECRIARNLGQ